jgi:hypothetical protein
MAAQRLSLLGLAACSVAALPSLAAAQGSDYVFCGNGIVCAMAPCPSGNALDLAAGKVIKGVDLNTTELSQLNRSAPDLSEKIQCGKARHQGVYPASW